MWKEIVSFLLMIEFIAAILFALLGIWSAWPLIIVLGQGALFNKLT